MNILRTIGAILFVGGVLAVAYGGFSYTKETHSADIGPLHLAVAEKERVNIPLWLGIGAIVGGVLLWAGTRKPND